MDEQINPQQSGGAGDQRSSSSPDLALARMRLRPTAGRWLAITALALACVPACPFISMAGAILGTVALWRIQSGKAIAGRRAAQAAVLVGTGMTVLTLILFSRIANSVEQRIRTQMIAQVEQVINAVADGNVAGARQVWATSEASRVSDQGIQEFSQAALDRYGRLQRFAIVSTAPTGSTFQQGFDVAGVFMFEKQQMTGSAQFEQFTPWGTIWPQVRLHSIVIEDRERGDLALPPATPETRQARQTPNGPNDRP